MRKLGEGTKGEVFALSDGRILKLMLADFGQLAAEEARALQMLETAGVPAPRFAGFVEVDDRCGIVLDGLDVGRTLHEEMRTKPWRLLAAARELAELHAAIHACSAPGLPSLHERLRLEISTSRSLPDRLRHGALSVLSTLPDGETVCHNDLHSRNVIVAGGRPVFIDWVRAARGHPLADIAVTLLQFRFGERRASLATQVGLNVARAVFCHAYLARYRHLRPYSTQQLREWLVPVTAAYAERRGGTMRSQLIAFLQRQLASRDRHSGLPDHLGQPDGGLR